MKKRCLLFSLIALNMLFCTAQAEIRCEELQSSLPDKVQMDHGDIHYDAEVLFRGTSEAEFCDFNAQRPSMLNVDRTLFSDVNISQKEHRVDNYGMYERQEDYFVLEDGATFLTSSDGRLFYQTPQGAALHQLYGFYSYEFEPAAADQEFIQNYESDLYDLINKLSLSVASKPILHQTMNHEKALDLAKRFDAEFKATFDKKVDSLAGILADCGESVLIEIPFAYGGIELPNYLYKIAANDRYIDMYNIVAVFSDGQLQYFTADSIYETTSAREKYSSVYDLNEAIEHFESKLNEGLILEDKLVYRIALENIVSATGTGQDDFEILPVWHFYMTADSLLEDVPLEMKDVTLIGGTEHYVFHAATGRWICEGR